MKKKKTSTIVLALASILLMAVWLQYKNTLAGISSALILVYLTGIAYWIVNVLSWLLTLPSLLYSLMISLPVISTLHAVIMPSMAKILLPIILPLQMLLSKIGPFKWIADRLRNVKSVKMKKCFKCSRQIPADGVVCPYCSIKLKHRRKNVPHKKRGP